MLGKQFDSIVAQTFKGDGNWYGQSPLDHAVVKVIDPQGRRFDVKRLLVEPSGEDAVSGVTVWIEVEEE